MRCTNEGGDEEQEDVGLGSRGGVGADLGSLIGCESVCVGGASTTAIGGGGGAPTPAAALEGGGEWGCDDVDVPRLRQKLIGRHGEQRVRGGLSTTSNSKPLRVHMHTRETR